MNQVWRLDIQLLVGISCLKNLNCFLIHDVSLPVGNKSFCLIWQTLFLSSSACLWSDLLNFSFKLHWTLRFERNIVFNGESAVLTPQTSELLRDTLLWVGPKERKKRWKSRTLDSIQTLAFSITMCTLYLCAITAWLELWVARNFVTSWSTLLFLLVPVNSSTSLKCTSNYVTVECSQSFNVCEL